MLFGYLLFFVVWGHSQRSFYYDHHGVYHDHDSGPSDGLVEGLVVFGRLWLWKGGFNLYKR